VSVSVSVSMAPGSDRVRAIPSIAEMISTSISAPIAPHVMSHAFVAGEAVGGRRSGETVASLAPVRTCGQPWERRRRSTVDLEFGGDFRTRRLDPGFQICSA
jgi:hypothetical protein